MSELVEDMANNNLSPQGEFKAYVSNLAWGVTEQDLQDHLNATEGVVNVEIMTRPDGRSKGCGIVTFDSEMTATRAMQELMDTEIQGRAIRLREWSEERPKRSQQQQRTQRPQRSYRDDQKAFESQPVATDGAPGPDAASVHVGNLAWSFTSEQLLNLCQEFGETKSAEIVVGRDGRSRGYGLVVFSNSQDAQNCISALHGTMCDGRDLSVHIDKKPDRRAPRAAPRGYAPRNDQNVGDLNDTRAPEYKVFVGNLPFSWSWQDLKDTAKNYGDVQFVDVAKDRDGQSRGFGIVSFSNIDDAYGCIEKMNGLEAEDRQLSVREDSRSPLTQA